LNLGLVLQLCVTFGGMCCWRRFGVARVFALVMCCRVMIVISLFSCWQKPWHHEGVSGGSRGRPHRRPLNYPL